MKHSSFVTSALATTLLSLLVGCSSSDDDSDDGDTITGGDTITLVDGTVVECGTAEASELSEIDVGDFSDDFESPTSFTVGPGASTLTATTVSGDLDYVTFTVGPCDTLTQLTVDSYTSASDTIAFISMQNGTAFTFPATEAAENTAEMLGLSHFGAADIGQDILPAIGEGAIAGELPAPLGFTPPLSAGDYTVWLNQTGAAESTASLVFMVDRGQ